MKKATGLFYLAIILLVHGGYLQAQKLSPHPDNPHYLALNGKPVILIGATDHYGSVMNGPFDYTTYLNTIKADGFNIIRVKSGTFTESGEDNNTMAVLPGKLITPYARSSEPSYINGGNKFDLSKWDDNFFKRLKDVVSVAKQKGVFVNFIFFTPFFDNEQFEVTPWNEHNHINGPAPVKQNDFYTLDKSGGFLALQEALIKKVLKELKDADNVLYEITYESGKQWVAPDWENYMNNMLQSSLRENGSKNLTVQNCGSKRSLAPTPFAEAAILNRVFTYPEVMAASWQFNRVGGVGETGFAPSNNDEVRMRAWQFLHAGAGMYVHMDHCFRVSDPTGDCDMSPAKALFGGGKIQRHELGILKGYFEKLNFINMAPDTSFILSSLPPFIIAYTMVNKGKEYSIYLSRELETKDGQPVNQSLAKLPATNLTVALPEGNYLAELLNPKDLTVLQTKKLSHRGGNLTLKCPKLKEEDLVIHISKQ